MFTVHLPRTASTVASSGPVAAAAPAAGPTLGQTVLLVEDEALLLDVTQAMLDGLGYRVLAATSPAQALDLAAAHPGTIDLLFTDVIMPGMDGSELHRRLLALRPGLRCLFTSGYTADIIARQGKVDAGLNFLQKPFKLDALAAAVEQALRG